MCGVSIFSMGKCGEVWIAIVGIGKRVSAGWMLMFKC